MIRKILFLLLLSVIASIAFADNFSLSVQEKRQMNVEAENWMDDMPDGIQDRLSDAVNHAMRGFFSEIEYFRNIGDTIGLKSYKVNIKNIQGGVSSNIPMRLYSGIGKNKNTKKPLLIYFHGGGWSMGSIETTDKFCRALATYGNINIISVAYPLAPEYSYPSAIDICTSATEYIISKAEGWGSGKEFVSIGGDGAGGNIALSVYEKLPQNYKIRSLVLYYPIINANGDLNPQTKRLFGRGYGFDSRLWEAYMNAYKGEEISFKKPLPPTLLISAGKDIIIDEIKSFSLKNKEINFVDFSEALHGFITDGQQKTAFRKAVEFTDNFLAR